MTKSFSINRQRGIVRGSRIYRDGLQNNSAKLKNCLMRKALTTLLFKRQRKDLIKIKKKNNDLELNESHISPLKPKQILLKCLSRHTEITYTHSATFYNPLMAGNYTRKKRNAYSIFFYFSEVDQMFQFLFIYTLLWPNQTPNYVQECM